MTPIPIYPLGSQTNTRKQPKVRSFRRRLRTGIEYIANRDARDPQTPLWVGRQTSGVPRSSAGAACPIILKMVGATS